MKFSINYSHPAADLAGAGRIRVDRFKCPDWPDLVDEILERGFLVAVHFSLTAGAGQASAAGWGLVERLLEKTDTPYVNLHLNPTQKDFPSIPVDSMDPAHQDQVLDAMIADIQAVTQRFGAGRVIVENVPYHAEAGWTLRPAVEPQNIRRIVDETGCGLLLDISHARIAAHTLGIDACEYMDSLPVDRLRELHFTGLHRVDGRLQDHLPVLPDDWPVLQWVTERISGGAWARPWMLAFEYGGVGGKFTNHTDPATLAAQAPEIYSLIAPI